MGRRYGWGRDTTDETRAISMSRLREWGMLCGLSGQRSIIWSQHGRETGKIGVCVDTFSDTPNIKFHYNSRSGPTEEWQEVKYSFPLEKIPCRFGGYKWYFICGLSRNGVYCGRRVRMLYEIGKYYGCRHCARLSYDSCNQSKRFRSGMWRILSQGWKSEDYYLQKVKRRFYKGKPTKKYRRFLAIERGYSNLDIEEMERQTFALDLATKRRK
jgi:hypothetical protein